MPLLNGHLVRRGYEYLGLDRHEFAAMVGIPVETLTNITSGNGSTSRSRAARIAKALEWPLEDVIAHPAKGAA